MAMEFLNQDVRYGIRALRRSPGFALTAILSLALGIGANTAIFTLMDAALLRNLPVKTPQELVLFGHTNGSVQSDGFPYSSYLALRDNNNVVTGLLAYHILSLNITVDGNVEPAATGQLVSGNYFSVLGVPAMLGRTLTPEDDLHPGAHPVCMISNGYFIRRFSGDRSVVGRKIVLSGYPFTIVGVTPPEFSGLQVGTMPDVTIPIMMQPQVMPGIERLTEQTQLNDWLHVFGRLKPGVTQAEALANLTVVHSASVRELVSRFANENPQFLRYLSSQKLTLAPGGRGISSLRPQFSRPLIVLMVFVSLVLMIACANVASLLLAKAAAREKETAVRVAIGAPRRRLVRQWMTESIVLACLSGAVGVMFALVGVRTLLGLLPQNQGIQLSVSFDQRMLLFTFAISLLTGIIFGLVPGLGAMRVDISSALNLQSRTSASGVVWSKMGKLLIVTQIVLSTVLLIGAGLLFRSLQKLQSVDTGFSSDRVLVTRLEPVGSDQKDAALTVRYEQLLKRIEIIPGIKAASLASGSPITRAGWIIAGANAQLSLPGGEHADVPARVPWVQVFPKSFDTLGIPILAGRDFGPQDVGRYSVNYAGLPPLPSDAENNFHLVAIINKKLAHQLFGKSDPIGRRFIWGGRSVLMSLEVVGLVNDSKFTSLRDEPGPMFFVPFTQTRTGRGQMTLEIQITGGDPTAAIPAIRREIQSFDSNAAPFEIETLNQQIDSSLFLERSVGLLSGMFGILAFALAAIGLYGLMAYNVARRTSEIGLRIALGATPWQVRLLVLRDATLLIAVGLVIGIPGALLGSRLLATLLFDVTARDPLVLGSTIGLMIIVGFLASYLPAFRASCVDPLVTLRNE